MSAAVAAVPSAGHCAGPGSATHVLRLTEDDRDAVLDHFLRLEPVARQLRFMQVARDETLVRYVAAMDFHSAACFGTFDAGGKLIALTEGLTCRGGRCIEAAFSTEAMWRRQGLARRGFAALAVWCIERGIECIVFHCHARNSAMRGVLRSLAATTTEDDGEIDAIARPTLPTLQERTLDCSCGMPSAGGRALT